MVTNHLRHRWNHLYKLKKQHGEAEQWVAYMPLEEVLVKTKGRSSHKKEMHTQELTKRVFFAAGSRAIQGRAPLGTIARQILHALSEQ